MQRVIGIGLDGASIEFIEEMIAAGRLPHFARLREASARVVLHDEMAYRHGLVWPQFVSGSEARLDGNWQCLTFDPTTYQGYHKTAEHQIDGAPPFWERIGARTISFDVPRTTVRGPGVHVTAWGAQAPMYARASQPRGLLRDIDARFGVHPTFENDTACGWHDPARIDRTVEGLIVGAHRRGEIAVDLMDRSGEWDFLLCVMSEAHSAAEFLWHALIPGHPLAAVSGRARRQLERVFEAVDEGVGHILEHAPADAAVVLFALDGIREGHGDVAAIALLPELLHRREFGTGLLRDGDGAKWKAAGCPPLVPRPGEIWRHALDAHLVDPPPPRLADRIPGYQAVRRTRPGRAVLERIKGAKLGVLGIPIPPESDVPLDPSDTAHEPLDPILFVGNYQPFRSSMRAFVLPTFGDGCVRINLVGRDAAGIVAPEDFAQECAEITELISECRDVRSGRPIASRVVNSSADDRFGRGRRYADLLVEWSGPIDAIEHPEFGIIGPLPFHRTGTHSGVGFAWLRGAGLAPGDLGERSTLDLAPTIARLLDPNAPLPPAGDPIEQLVH